MFGVEGRVREVCATYLNVGLWLVVGVGSQGRDESDSAARHEAEKQAPEH